MTDKSEPAFPAAAFGPSGDEFYQTGLTKREWFAGLAMQGLVEHYSGVINAHQECAGDAVAFADALIEELNK